MANELQNLAIRVNKLLLEELAKAGIQSLSAQARIYDAKTIGVQGDAKTYAHPAEITIPHPKTKDGGSYGEKDFYEFLQKLSNRITNEIQEINRVVYVLGTRPDFD